MKKKNIDHSLEQGLTAEEARYIATIVDDAPLGYDADIHALRQSQGADDESLTPQGLHDFNTLINNSEKECASWAKPPKDNA